MTKSTANFLFPFFCLALCLIFPTACSEGVARGLSLSLDAALPALFPALVLSGILVRQIGKGGEKCFLIPFVLGLFCGFPIGAASVAGLVRDGRLSKKDGERLLFFCNNASPAFLISYCGKTVLGDTKKGLFLFLLQSVLSAFFLFFWFGKRMLRREKKKEKKEAHAPDFWKSLPDALRESTNSFLYIMSCVIFFSFFTELMRHLFSLTHFSFAMLGLFSELCGGVSHLRYFAPSLAFPLCALGCGWGGCSVHLQTAGLLENASLSVKSHLAGKIIFSLLMFLMTLFFQKLL